MKKLFLSFFAVMLAVFSMQAETKTYIYDFSKNTNWATTQDGSTNVGTSSSNKLGKFYYKDTGDAFNANSTGYFNSGYFLWGKSGAYIELPTFEGEKITNITATSSSGHSTKVNVGVYCNTTVVVAAKNWKTTSTDYSYDIPAEYQSSVLRLQITNGNNSQITKLVITTETTGGETPAVDVAEPTFAPADGTTFGDEGLNVTINAEEDLTVYYSIDNKANYTEGNILNITETTTVYAYAEDAEGNQSDVVAATYTYIDPNVTEATLSFADKAQRTSYSTSQQVWEQNGITFTNDKASSTTNVGDYANPVRCYAGSNITISAAREISKIEFDCVSGYVINIDGATTVETKVTVYVTPSSKTYTVTGLNAQKRLNAITVTFATGNEITLPTLPASSEFVGSTIVEITNNAEGTTLYYSTDNVEFVEYTKALNITETTTVYAYAQDAEGNKSGTVSATYTRVAADPVITCDGDASAFEGSITVTISTENNAKAYYTLNGKKPTASSTLYQAPLNIGADATLKVIAIEEGDYESDIVEKEFKKAVSSVATGGATLVTDAADLAVGDKIIIASSTKGKVASAISKTYMTEVTATFDGATIESIPAGATILTLGKSGEKWTLTNDNGELLGATDVKEVAWDSGDTTWSISIENGNATIQNGTDARGRFLHNVSSTRFTTYTSDANTSMLLPQIYKASVSYEAYTLTVSSAGWATLFLNYDAVIPAGAKCYYISEVKSDAVTLAEISNSIPANTAVIVEAEAGSYTFNVATEDVATIESNMAGRTAAEYVEEDAYILAKVDGNIGFYPVEKLGGVFLCYANRAYLPASALTAEQQNSVGFRFDFATTAIEEVKGENGAEAIYDLQGRRIDEITEPGIYIVNGVKVLVK